MKALYRKKPLEFPSLNENEASCLKAVYQGKASEQEQILAMNTILKKFCGTGAVTFHEDARVHAFSDGMRTVGIQLLYVFSEPLKEIIDDREKSGPRTNRK